jgi:sulfite reductase (NADPH) flavoprotein alpha-component
MFPEHAPFSSDQRQTLAVLLAGFDSAQRAWLSGFLAAGGSVDVAQAASAPAIGTKLTVLYGSESGNCEELADRAVKEARQRGFQAVMKNMAEVSLKELGEVPNLLVIVSTWGDGEPPDSVLPFYQELIAAGSGLSGLRFSVCGLGDSAYEKFCQTGKDIDARLEALDATRVVACQDCDVDYEDAYAAWLERALAAMAPTSATEAVSSAVSAAAPALEYGKKNPFWAEVLEVVLLSGEGSAKEMLHLEYSLAGSGMCYEPGDALAVFPVNAPDMVQAVLGASKLTGNEEIVGKSTGPKRLADALREDFDITNLSRIVLAKLAETTGSEALKALLADAAKEHLKEYVSGRQIVDALHEFAPLGLVADALAGILRKLPPRLYSIASSPLAHPGEAHLTVSAVRYESHGRIHHGVCSTYLADRVKPGDKVAVFVQPNKNFRLPADPSTPVIMVGPGTGIAPFRAFVEHRAARGDAGKNWLFMGDQHYLHDFLYQLEWQDYLKRGVLTRLDVAFSRDQPEKVYVQHRLRERAAELYAWLEQGAHFYVCGDAALMAADVHETLVEIIREQGGKSRKAAEDYAENLKKTQRYQRDVY